MAENSKIEWTTHTFNPWIGCTKVSPGCDNCYAEAMMDHRYHRVQWGSGSRSRTSRANWRKPLAWDRAAGDERPRVFCASLADVFDNAVPPAWRVDLFDLIRRTPNLDWLLLTKRIGNVSGMLPPDWDDGYRNVWLGITVVNQAEADRDIPKLLEAPAALRFLSCEPLLGEISFRWASWHDYYRPGWRERGESMNHLDGLRELDWIIVGGESGPGARPFVLGYAKEIVRQCQEASVPVFVKQLGAGPVNREGEPCPQILDRKGAALEEWPEVLRVRQFPSSPAGSVSPACPPAARPLGMEARK